MKYEIEIEGLPEGWELESIKLPESSTSQINDRTISIHNLPGALISLKKKQPRRIVLVETDEENIKHDNSWCSQHFTRGLILTQQPKRWREVKETDLSLHNADDNESLRLSMDDARELLNYIPTGTAFSGKLLEFIKGKQ